MDEFVVLYFGEGSGGGALICGVLHVRRPQGVWGEWNWGLPEVEGVADLNDSTPL